MKIEIEKKKLEEAFSLACSNTKNVLLTLFGKEAVLPERPDYSDYRNIKTINDVYKAFHIDERIFELNISDLPKDVQAFMKLRMVRDALNPRWIPDWANTDEYKYYPWFKIEKKDIPAGVGSAYSGVALGVSCLSSYAVASSSDACCGGALASENREIAIWFGEHFADIWKEFLLPNA